MKQAPIEQQLATLWDNLHIPDSIEQTEEMVMDLVTTLSPETLPPIKAGDRNSYKEWHQQFMSRVLSWLEQWQNPNGMGE
jgi:hypothetical protein